MGLSISSLFDRLGFGAKEAKLLVLGLDNAGKTTMLYRLKVGEVVHTLPTVGFNVESVNYKNRVKFTAWDVGGQKKIRALWRHYYHGTDALVFLVDSADCGDERMAEVREQLHSMLQYEELADAAVLVFANKQDMKGAATPSVLADKLQLRKLTNEWYIQGCSAKTGEGMYEGLDWVCESLKKTSRSK